MLVSQPSEMIALHGLGSPMSSRHVKSSPKAKRRCSRGSFGSPIGDRFIPNRTSLDVEMSNFRLLGENSKENGTDTTLGREEYKLSLAEALFNGKMTEGRIIPLSEKCSSPLSPRSPCSPMRELYYPSDVKSPFSPKFQREIPSVPEKILDAPEFVDDYYLNLLDWSVNSILAVALGNAVYFLNTDTGESSALLKLNNEGAVVTSVSFSNSGGTIAVGTSEAKLLLYDVATGSILRSLTGHSARVGALDWNQHILTSGSRDTLVLNHDVRARMNLVSIFEGHSQEVCGLKWSSDGKLLASGGNDNLLNIWEASNSNAPKHSFDHHQAAVKALAWCPFQSNLLASGGGTADRCIRFWNTSTGSCINCIDTKSQVCALQWSTHYKELISSHGFSQNQLTVWKYPSMTKITELKGHSSRVLHMVKSADGTTVASLSADETLRFWQVWQHAPQHHKSPAAKKNMLDLSAIALR